MTLGIIFILSGFNLFSFSFFFLLFLALWFNVKLSTRQKRNRISLTLKIDDHQVFLMPYILCLRYSVTRVYP